MMIRFVVYGTPEPQGSKTAMIMGVWTKVNGARACINPRAIIVEGRDVKRKDGTRSDGRARHKRWRAAVEREASVTAQKREVQLASITRAGKLDGPLSVEVTYYLPRPPSTPRSVLYPAVKPDIEKLDRAVHDGLKPLITDDSRIVRHFSEKLYADSSRPRAIVSIETLPRTLKELEAASEGIA